MKKSAFKSPYLWSVLLIVIGLPFTSINADVGTIMILVGIAAIVIALVRRVLSKRKAKQESKRPDPSKPPKYRTETMKISGTSYRQDEIKSLGVPNDDYSLSKKQLLEDYEGEKVFALDFDPKITLVPEPTNEYDANAIRVEADGVLIGYVPKGKTKYVRELMDAGKLYFVDANIEGGKYKLADDGELEIDETDFYADLILKIENDLEV